MFENRVMRICGPKGQEATRSERKLHNGKKNNFYSPPDIIKVIKQMKT
jgi:hypothetical protein